MGPVGSDQSNGAVESKIVHLVPQLPNCYMQQLETNGGATTPVLKFSHPMTAWCLVHKLYGFEIVMWSNKCLVLAVWIRNHYVVQQGQTAFEEAFDRVYNGRICSFGEVVLACISHDFQERCAKLA